MVYYRIRFYGIRSYTIDIRLYTIVCDSIQCCFQGKVYDSDAIVYYPMWFLGGVDSIR